MKYLVPIASGEIDGYFVYIPREIATIVAGTIEELLSSRLYASYDDYNRGYNAVACVLGGFMSCNAKVLIEKLDGTYRLIDTIHNGTVYTVTSVDPLVIEPPIPLVPGVISVPPGEKARLEEILEKLDQIAEHLAENDEDFDAILSAINIIGGLLA